MVPLYNIIHIFYVFVKAAQYLYINSFYKIDICGMFSSIPTYLKLIIIILVFTMWYNSREEAAMTQIEELLSQIRE